jgi:hypothetical protein
MLRLAVKVIRYELGLWRSLYRWILRRPPAGANAAAFGYASAVTPIYLAFIVVSAIEVPIVHLLLPWETVRLVADAIGVYGVLWMIGMLASVRVHPHVVGASGLRVRYGISVDVTIPWEAIATIRARNHSLPRSRAIQFERTESGLIAHIVLMSQTNVDVVLREPMTLPLPKGTGEPVRELRLCADDPAALVARAREHLAAAEPRGVQTTKE